MRPLHWIAIDCVVGGFIALCDTAVIGKHVPDDHAKWLVVLLFMAVVFVPMALRRRAPVTAFGALLIIGVLLSKLSPAVPAVIFLAAAFVLYTVTVEGRRRTGAAALGLILAVMVFLTSTGTGRGPRSDAAVEFVPVALANVIAWMTGYSMRQRRLYVVMLQEQAASSAVAEERLRIARELHDVVAHSMSVIAVQAGYGQYVIEASPDGAKDALGAIQATSRDALEEMRRMLGVLRQQDVTPGPARTDPAALGQAPPVPRQAPLAPAPGLAGLDRLIERTRGAGVQVTLEVSGAPRPAPAGVDLSAYRIIQEALTNVVRHAGTGARCAVSVGYTDSDLVIRVTDDGGLPVALPSVSVAASGTGHGIIGMRERVHLCGGTFGAGPLPDGGFQVTAALPLPAAGRPAEGVGTEGGFRTDDDFRAEEGARTDGGSRTDSVARTEGGFHTEGGFRTEGGMGATPVPLPAGPPPAVQSAAPTAHSAAVATAAAGNVTPGTGDGTRAPLGAVAGDGGGRG
jgi:signal transduction histidine kinase